MEKDVVSGQGPTVWYDGGSRGRVLVADSQSYYEGRPWLDDVAVGASFAGAPIAAMPLRHGVKAWIGHEAGPGKDQAGISGLAFSDRFGVPAAAVATAEAGLSRGDTMITARVAAVNDTAKALGVRPGMTGGEAAKLMLDAPRGKPVGDALDDFVDDSVHVMKETPNGTIYAVWSFTRVVGEHRDDVFTVASHGGNVMAQYALRVRPKGLIANDAGRGLDDSGASGIFLVDKLFGIPAATVSTDSARIGDGVSTYRDGVISMVNGAAERLGVRVGMPAREAADLMVAAPRPAQEATGPAGTAPTGEAG